MRLAIVNEKNYFSRLQNMLHVSAKRHTESESPVYSSAVDRGRTSPTRSSHRAKGTQFAMSRFILFDFIGAEDGERIHTHTRARTHMPK